MKHFIFLTVSIIFIVFHHYYMQPFKCVKVKFKATFNLFTITADGFIFKCRELQHTESCFFVLGCILIDEHCFVFKSFRSRW
jgi:hypothetical protein